MYRLVAISLVKRNERFYIFNNLIIKKKLINKNHDNFLTKDFKTFKKKVLLTYLL